MKALRYLLLGLALLALPAQAQQPPFSTATPSKLLGLVVASCGSGSATANNYAQLTIDTTGKLCVSAAVASSLVVGTTTITSGTDTRVLYDNNGTLGEYQITGSGKVVMDTGATIGTPIINSAAHVGGTWVADATWTLPAHTLGGTLTMNGQTISGAVVFNNAMSGITDLTSTGNTNLGDGASDVVTMTGGSTNPLKFGRLTDATNYFGISFNSQLNTGLVGIWSRGTTDDALVVEGGSVVNIRAGLGTQVAAFTTTLLTLTTPILSPLTTDATHTDASVCMDTTSKQFYFGSGSLGICLGTSSSRYKRDIQDQDYGLAEVLGLKPISYRYREDSGMDPNHEVYGFTAEQTYTVAPKLVGLDAQGRENSVDMVGMIPMLVKAVQQLKAEIDAK